MNLVQQLAEYQNAPIQTLEAAKQGANPAISPWVAGAILSDRIEKQKRMQNMQGAAQGPQPTVSEQQDQALSGIMSLQGAPQMPAAPQPPAPQEGPGMASGGIISSRMDPRMFDFSGGGIIAFSGEEQSDVPKAAPKKLTKEELAALYELEKAAGRTAQGPAEVPPAPAAAPAPAPAKTPSGIMSPGPVEKAVTSSPEWRTMEKARTASMQDPKLVDTASGLAAERAAHLKAQGIEKAPWETAAEQTAALRKILGDEDAARAKDRADNERDERYRTFVANLGGGSFGQSAQGGLRANLKREAEQKAEDQRIKELRYNQNLKLNEIDAKAKELQYNEAVGDVAAAQKNRAEIAALQRSLDKDRAQIAEKQATLRGQAAAHDLAAKTQVQTAGMRAAGAQNLTPKQIADIKAKAIATVDKERDAKGMAAIEYRRKLKADPGYYDRRVAEVTAELMGQAGGATMPTATPQQGKVLDWNTIGKK